MPLGKDTDRMGNAREPWKRLGFMGPDMGRIEPMPQRQKEAIVTATENQSIKASGTPERHIVEWDLEGTEQNPQIGGQLSFWNNPFDITTDITTLNISRDHAEQTARGPGPLPVRAFAEDYVRHETEGGGEDSQEEEDRRWGLAAQMGIKGTAYNDQSESNLSEGENYISRKYRG